MKKNGGCKNRATEYLISSLSGITIFIRLEVCTAVGRMRMTRKMTLVFHDEDLYTQLKIEAVKRRTTASDIVADAVREWLESCEDAELAPVIEASRTEWKEKGGRPWSEAEREIEESINRRKGAAEAKGV
jgi:hypothetical protein